MREAPSLCPLMIIFKPQNEYMNKLQFQEEEKKKGCSGCN